MATEAVAVVVDIAITGVTADADNSN